MISHYLWSQLNVSGAFRTFDSVWGCPGCSSFSCLLGWVALIWAILKALTPLFISLQAVKFLFMNFHIPYQLLIYFHISSSILGASSLAWSCKSSIYWVLLSYYIIHLLSLLIWQKYFFFLSQKLFYGVWFVPFQNNEFIVCGFNNSWFILILDPLLCLWHIDFSLRLLAAWEFEG